MSPTRPEAIEPNAPGRSALVGVAARVLLALLFAGVGAGGAQTLTVIAAPDRPPSASGVATSWVLASERAQAFAGRAPAPIVDTCRRVRGSGNFACPVWQKDRAGGPTLARTVVVNVGASGNVVEVDTR